MYMNDPHAHYEPYQDADTKEVIGGLEGIYVKSYEFAKEGVWTQADLEQVRSQFKAPEWNRMVGVRSGEDKENVEVWVRMTQGRVTGVALLATGPTEFTVANLVGSISPDALSQIGGQFGLPKMKTGAAKPEEKKDEPE